MVFISEAGFDITVAHEDDGSLMFTVPARNGLSFSGESDLTFRQGYLDAFTTFDSDDSEFLHVFHFGYTLVVADGLKSEVEDYADGCFRVYKWSDDGAGKFYFFNYALCDDSTDSTAVSTVTKPREFFDVTIGTVRDYDSPSCVSEREAGIYEQQKVEFAPQDTLLNRVLSGDDDKALQELEELASHCEEAADWRSAAAAPQTELDLPAGGASPGGGEGASPDDPARPPAQSSETPSPRRRTFVSGLIKARNATVFGAGAIGAGVKGVATGAAAGVKGVATGAAVGAKTVASGAATGAKTVASGATAVASTAATGAKVAATRVQEGGHKVFNTAQVAGTRAKSAAQRTAAQVGETATATAATVQHVAQDAAYHAQTAGEEVAFAARSAVKDGPMLPILRFASQRVLEFVEEDTKRKVKDPSPVTSFFPCCCCGKENMPRCIQRLVDRVIGLVFEDVRDEVDEMLYDGVGAKPVSHTPGCFDEEVPDKHDLCCKGHCCGCCNRVRAFILYTLMPYDRSIWSQIRDPCWYLIVFWAFIPTVGVCQIYFMILFALISRSDPFQLAYYIVQFKGFQFITVGVISMLYGASQYYICTMQSSPEEIMECFNGSNIPGRGGDYLDGGHFGWQYALEQSIFGVQVLLAWMAFWRLNADDVHSKALNQQRAEAQKRDDAQYNRRAERRTERGEAIRSRNNRGSNPMQRTGPDDLDVESGQGGESDQDESKDDDGCCMSCISCCLCSGTGKGGQHGGRMGLFVRYDTFVFVAVATTLLIASLSMPMSDQQLFGTVYWLKTLYGLMSFPFLFFKVPIFFQFFTHAKQTGYNKKGACVKFVGPDRGSKEKQRSIIASFKSSLPSVIAAPTNFLPRAFPRRNRSPSLHRPPSVFKDVSAEGGEGTVEV